jgi:hypothetical protein
MAAQISLVCRIAAMPPASKAPSGNAVHAKKCRTGRARVPPAIAADQTAALPLLPLTVKDKGRLTVNVARFALQH